MRIVYSVYGILSTLSLSLFFTSVRMDFMFRCMFLLSLLCVVAFGVVHLPTLYNLYQAHYSTREDHISKEVPSPSPPSLHHCGRSFIPHFNPAVLKDPNRLLSSSPASSSLGLIITIPVFSASAVQRTPRASNELH